MACRHFASKLRRNIVADCTGTGLRCNQLPRVSICPFDDVAVTNQCNRPSSNSHCTHTHTFV